MRRRTTLTITLALGLALVGGAGAARAADDDHTGQEIGTILSLDPEQHIVVLSTGTQLLVTDPDVFARLHEGELVMIDFTHEGGRTFVNSIEPANAPAASPTLQEPSPDDPTQVESPVPPSVIFEGSGGDRLEVPEAP